ncbi:MAG: ABC transporter ATP-binding protein [bacterium]
MLAVIRFTINKVKSSNRILFYSFLILSIAYAVLSFLTTLIFREIIDTVNGTSTFFHLSIWGILIFKLGFDFFANLITGTKDYLLPQIKKKSSLQFLNELIDKTAELDIASLENPKTVGIISRAYSRIHFQFEYFFRNIVLVLTTSIEIIFALVIFIFVSPLGALMLLLTNVLNTYIKVRLKGANFNIYKADYQTRLKFGYATDLLTNRDTLLELKLFQNFTFLKKKILKIYNEFINNEINQEKKNLIIGSIVDILPIIASFIFILVLANQLYNQTISVGIFVFLFTNMLIFSGSLARLSLTLVSVAAESNSIRDIIDFYELKPKFFSKVLDAKEKLLWQQKLSKPCISFENVNFRYPNSHDLALANINLIIPWSQNLAIVGENGAGKTTLIKLLLRVYDPETGVIKINGIDLKEIPLNALYTCFATLFQNFGKFNLTIAENLELAARRKLSDQEMTDYLQYANAWKFIKTTQDQLQQQLGPEFENGIDLSGGQWQSLAIARTYAKQAAVVILDEPTSAIDAKSEMEIFDRLNKKMRKETLIFISHRFSTIKDAERIVVLDRGRIVEQGTHAELMLNNLTYAKLYQIQLERLKRDS